MPGCWALGSSRFRAVTAISRLLRLPVECVLVVPPAVLAELDPVGIVLLVLHGGVVSPFADGAGEGDDLFHACLFGLGEKEKSLGFLGAVNSSRGIRPPSAWATFWCVTFPGRPLREQGSDQGVSQPGDVALPGPAAIRPQQPVDLGPGQRP